MANSVTWDTAFEADPGDDDVANNGANEIRKLKLAISERLEPEMNFKAGSSPLLKPGIASVIYSGTTTQINALSSPANGALAIDTTTKSLKRYGGSWANMTIKHSTLANLTDSDDHTQYLKVAGGQTLTGNLAVADGIEIDGVDISVHWTAYVATAAAFVAHAANNVAHANTFGAWSTNQTLNANHTANTDGIVVASGPATYIGIYTPSTAPNITLRVGSSNSSNIYDHSVTCPVKKGDTWRVYVQNEGAGKVTAYFLPIGS